MTPATASVEARNEATGPAGIAVELPGELASKGLLLHADAPEKGGEDRDQQPNDGEPVYKDDADAEQHESCPR